MACTQIIRKQILKKDIKEIWDFMSSPSNLENITPKSMDFQILSKNTDQKMYPGMIIKYKVTPLLYIPMTWVTEITHVKEKKYFVDEQRIGPYKMWHHEHIFEQKNEGILMTDIITYVPPFGVVGSISNFIFIKNKINKIFDYRQEVLNRIFNNKEQSHNLIVSNQLMI